MTTHDGGRFQRGGIRRGYSIDEVDAFCRRLDEELKQRWAGRRLSTGLTPSQVRQTEFSRERGGYRESEVTDHLTKMAAELDWLAAADTAVGSPAGDHTTDHTSDRELSALLSVADRRPGERFERTPRLLAGYQVEQVDQFVDRVRAVVRSTLTASEVAGVQFDTVRPGYAVEEVDHWLDAVEAYVRRRTD